MSKTFEAQGVQYLLSTTAIRERCEQLYSLAEQGKLRNFILHEERIDIAAEYVTAVTRERYPSLKTPFHSRYRHFEVGGIDRLAALRNQLGADRDRTAAALFDLVVVSVLVDAGAGAGWSYVEPDSKQTFRSSEGLAVASYQMFCQGAFSASATDPLRVDAKRLVSITEAELAQGFQVTPANPLLGVAGRVALLRGLGSAILENRGRRFETEKRPSDLIQFWRGLGAGNGVSATTLLETLLYALGSIWPTRHSLDGIPLGDVWKHPLIEGDGKTAGFVPFHKLSQWLTYSLLEPLGEAGILVQNLDGLTGLPEYRNGGLLLDLGVLELRDVNLANESHDPSSELIVEWRALTVALLDRIAERMRALLKLSPAQFPLACALEGGTWAAGRKVARERRADGSPPLRITSDGTVF
jgi:hypothetical protein